MLPITKFFCLLCLFLSLSSRTVFSNPIGAKPAQNPYIPRALQPPTDTSVRRDHPHELTRVSRRAAGSGTTHYRTLGGWRMALTAATSFYNAAKDLAEQSPTTNLVNFLASAAEEASDNIASKVAESANLQFGLGSLQLAFRIRDGEGGGPGPVTVPWELIKHLAEYFEMRARYGNALGFRAVVTGPLGVNVLGGSPWIEVVLVVAGQEVMDGVPWSVY